MALAAFLGGIMIDAGGMAGQAELAPRYQLSDGGLVVAFSAGRVGIDRRGVSLCDLRGSVASRAGGRAGVVIVVAGDARFGSCFRLQRDRGSVTLGARDPHVCRVLEGYRARPRWVCGNRDLECQGASGIQLACRVTGGAFRARWSLMMADLTTPGRLEGQPVAPRGGVVAGEAGELAMALVGEGVGGLVWWRRVPLAS
jgi:hypothetical protein